MALNIVNSLLGCGTALVQRQQCFKGIICLHGKLEDVFIYYATWHDSSES